jgi:hypothetical protein
MLATEDLGKSRLAARFSGAQQMRLHSKRRVRPLFYPHDLVTAAKADQVVTTQIRRPKTKSALAIHAANSSRRDPLDAPCKPLEP